MAKLPFLRGDGVFRDWVDPRRIDPDRSLSTASLFGHDATGNKRSRVENELALIALVSHVDDQAAYAIAEVERGYFAFGCGPFPERDELTEFCRRSLGGAEDHKLTIKRKTAGAIVSAFCLAPWRLCDGQAGRHVDLVNGSKQFYRDIGALSRHSTVTDFARLRG